MGFVNVCTHTCISERCELVSCRTSTEKTNQYPLLKAVVAQNGTSSLGRAITILVALSGNVTAHPQCLCGWLVQKTEQP